MMDDEKGAKILLMANIQPEANFATTRYQNRLLFSTSFDTPSIFGFTDARVHRIHLVNLHNVNTIAGNYLKIEDTPILAGECQ